MNYEREHEGETRCIATHVDNCCSEISATTHQGNHIIRLLCECFFNVLREMKAECKACTQK